MWKWIKRIVLFLSVLLLLVISVLVFLHTPWGRGIVRDKAVGYLEKKLKTTVSIGDIDYLLPN